LQNRGRRPQGNRISRLSYPSQHDL
jgi:hypothetical protein